MRSGGFGVALRAGLLRAPLSLGPTAALAIVWDVEISQELLALRGHTADVWSVAFSPDGRRIATGGNDKTVAVRLRDEPLRGSAPMLPGSPPNALNRYPSESGPPATD